MLAQLMQRQIPIGSKVSFSLKNGREVSGVLVELGRDHITLESEGGTITILNEVIGAWQVLDEVAARAEQASQVSDTNESSKLNTDLTPPQSSPPIPHSSFSDPAVTRKLLEIEVRFRTQSQLSTIQPKRPDFTFPAAELRRKQSVDASVVWNRVKDKYSYAEKINELGAQYGRIQPLVNEFKTLAEQFPNSYAVKRHLAYFHLLLGHRPEALSLYKSAAIASNETWDWYNVAALALTEGQEELAFHSFGQFFRTSPITEVPEAWHLYVKLLQKHTDYRSLDALVRSKARVLSQEELVTILETVTYLLQTTDHQELASEVVRKWLAEQPLPAIILETLIYLDSQPSESYRQVASEPESQPRSKPSRKDAANLPQGHIYTYKPSRNFGFLQGADGKTYFFHRSAISDDELFEKVQNLSSDKQIPVVFEPAQGPKGPLAIGVTLYRTLEETFARATEYANDGEYPKAIAHIKRVLAIDSSYPRAQELYESWREYAKVSAVPRGSSPYARAKRVQLIEKDLDRAAQLLRAAISQGDNTESAVKDLAMLLDQQNKPEEAIQVLTQNRGRIQDQQSVDNMLITFYQRAGQYDRSIVLLKRKRERAPTEGKKAQIDWQIATGYLRTKDYSRAEHSFRTVLSLQSDNKAAQRNIAFCLFQQKRYDEALKILEQILDTSPDAQAAALHEAISQAKAGQSTQINEIIIETTLPDLSREISGFTRFYLDRCDFQGVPPDSVQRQTFGRGDIQTLEDLATKLGTRRPKDRADYYLSAAKIVSLLEDEDPNLFYKYMCRSFASRGDAIVIESRPLDAAREFYSEALSVYDGDRSQSRDEQDAVNALVRFLFSTLGQSQIPIKPNIPSIDETLETVLSQHPDRRRVFDAISYLVFRSRYAANRILNRIYNKSSFQAMALEYLKSESVNSKAIKTLDDFVRLWNELIRRKLDEIRSISSEIRFLSRLELSTASLESGIERTKTLASRVAFDLDQQRAGHLQRILEAALELCKQVAFEEQERLCTQIVSRAEDLLAEIEVGPTKLSIEEIYPVVETIQKKVSSKLEDLYESSTPQLTLRLPVESYTPDKDQRIEAQVVVSNRIGCSPAEALELVIPEYEDTFAVKADGSLRGGEQRILKVPIQVGKEAFHSQAFSLPVYARYRTRSGEIKQTTVRNFSIRLYSGEDFSEIENPYAAYAEGGIVGDPTMFYGREELIAIVTKVLQESRAQSKCVVIYGQKRAGKSSILHHLKNKLQANRDVLVLDLGNIGSILDENSAYPFLYQILWSILRKLEYAIEDREAKGYDSLNLTFPTDKAFYEYPSPLVLFKDVFDRFTRSISKSSDWRNSRLILLIDEFSYIHGYIARGLIPESFMKNWKALLQENYFSAVLVGQDVMPKFKQRFPNEFGTTQDERVSYLRREDAVRLIDEPIRIGGRGGESRYREKAVERIIDLTAGSPFYTQILCNRLVEYMNRKYARLVTEADVDQITEDLIRGVNALGLDKFENLIDSGDTSEDAISNEDTLRVLAAIAVNSQTGPASRHSIGCETQTPLDVILDDLVKRDVVERQRGQYYMIRVGLFKEWLIAHQGLASNGS